VANKILLRAQLSSGAILKRLDLTHLKISNLKAALWLNMIVLVYSGVEKRVLLRPNTKRAALAIAIDQSKNDLKCILGLCQATDNLKYWVSKQMKPSVIMGQL
jgi:hypothetical protein